jgi:ABC-2 type transport system permease protein
MSKILIVAQSEFATLVRSKAFIIGVILMPVMMGGSILLVRATRDSTDVRDREFAFIDHSGVMTAPLMAAAAETNAAGEKGGSRTAPRFLPRPVDTTGRRVDEVRLELSEQVRRKELFAFVEFPEELLDPAAGAQIRYYSDHPSYTALPQWLRAVANRVILNERFRAASIDRTVIDRLTRQAPIEQLGLFTRDREGRIEPAKEVDQARAFGVPFTILILMYITVMSSAPQLLNSIIEEKMSRISEVLMGSVTPFQLMMGKLIGSASVSVLLALIYVSGAMVVANYWGYADAVTPALLAWFALFLIMAVVLFGAIFIAIGAACNDLKDSQNMVTPVMLLVMLPMVTAGGVLRAPDGMMATSLSIVPTAAPFLMMLRISLQPGPPVWQIALSVGLMILTVVASVWAAGKIFRTGLLMQGKSATIGEMVRWVREK